MISLTRLEIGEIGRPKLGSSAGEAALLEAIGDEAGTAAEL
jgi:hypothetical protein